MNRTWHAGFSLVELLVAMALFGILMTAAVNFFTQTSRTSAQSMSYAEQQQELLNAQQLIVGRLKDAFYIYPAGQSISMSATNDPFVRNPVTGSNVWQIGSSPIVAAILPPVNAGLDCSVNIDGCYRFTAYYAVQRDTWVSAAGSTAWRNPGQDAANAATWVLAEYRAQMPASFSMSVNAATFVFPPTPPAVPITGTANLLADRIAPSVVTPGFTDAGATYTMFAFSAGTAVNGVTFNVATAAKVGGTVIRRPNATDEYTLAVFPSNLGKRPRF